LSTATILISVKVNLIKRKDITMKSSLSVIVIRGGKLVNKSITKIAQAVNEKEYETYLSNKRQVFQNKVVYNLK